MGLQDELRAQREKTERWIKQRTRDVARSAQDLEARGRKIYADSIRTGERVLARTPSEVKQLAVAAAKGQLPQYAVKRVVEVATPTVKRVVSEAKTPAGRERLLANAKQQGRAAISGAADEVTFGAADRVLSAGEAVLEGGLSGASERYKANLDRRKAEDEYDATRYGAARTVGQVAGVAATVAGTGAAGAATKVLAKGLGGKAFARAVRAADKVTRSAQMTPAGLTGLATVGGASSGVAGQLVNDAMSGRLSSAGDYAGAAVGGAVGGLVQRIPGARIANRTANGRFRRLTDTEKSKQRLVDFARHPVTAGGVEGATTSAAQALLNGRDLDPLEIARATRGGIVGAQIGDVAGKFGSNSLSAKTKERLGEQLSTVKSFASGQGTPWGKVVDNINTIMPTVARGETPSGAGVQRWIQLPSGRFTRVDRVTNKGFAVESKGGAHARPTTNQEEALRTLPADRYRIDHWLPADGGRIISIPASVLGAQLSSEERW